VARRPAGLSPPPPAGTNAPPATPSPAPRSVHAAASAQHREFWVQVGAFRTADAAARLVRRLRDRAVTIATAGDRVTPMLRVLVGPFAERAAASAPARGPQASGIAAFP